MSAPQIRQLTAQDIKPLATLGKVFQKTLQPANLAKQSQQAADDNAWKLDSTLYHDVIKPLSDHNKRNFLVRLGQKIFWRLTGKGDRIGKWRCQLTGSLLNALVDNRLFVDGQTPPYWKRLCRALGLKRNIWQVLIGHQPQIQNDFTRFNAQSSHLPQANLLSQWTQTARSFSMSRRAATRYLTEQQRYKSQMRTAFKQRVQHAIPNNFDVAKLIANPQSYATNVVAQLQADCDARIQQLGNQPHYLNTQARKQIIQQMSQHACREVRDFAALAPVISELNTLKDTVAAACSQALIQAILSGNDIVRVAEQFENQMSSQLNHINGQLRTPYARLRHIPGYQALLADIRQLKATLAQVYTELLGEKAYHCFVFAFGQRQKMADLKRLQHAVQTLLAEASSAEDNWDTGSDSDSDEDNDETAHKPYTGNPQKKLAHICAQLNPAPNSRLSMVIDAVKQHVAPLLADKPDILPGQPITQVHACIEALSLHRPDDGYILMKSELIAAGEDAKAATPFHQALRTIHRQWADFEETTLQPFYNELKAPWAFVIDAPNFAQAHQSVMQQLKKDIDSMMVNLSAIERQTVTACMIKAAAISRQNMNWLYSQWTNPCAPDDDDVSESKAESNEAHEVKIPEPTLPATHNPQPVTQYDRQQAINRLRRQLEAVCRYAMNDFCDALLSAIPQPPKTRKDAHTMAAQLQHIRYRMPLNRIRTTAAAQVAVIRKQLEQLNEPLFARHGTYILFTERLKSDKHTLTTLLQAWQQDRYAIDQLRHTPFAEPLHQVQGHSTDDALSAAQASFSASCAAFEADFNRQADEIEEKLEANRKQWKANRKQWAANRKQWDAVGKQQHANKEERSEIRAEIADLHSEGIACRVEIASCKAKLAELQTGIAEVKARREAESASEESPSLAEHKLCEAPPAHTEHQIVAAGNTASALTLLRPKLGPTYPARSIAMLKSLCRQTVPTCRAALLSKPNTMLAADNALAVVNGGTHLETTLQPIRAAIQQIRHQLAQHPEQSQFDKQTITMVFLQELAESMANNEQEKRTTAESIAAIQTLCRHLVTDAQASSDTSAKHPNPHRHNGHNGKRLH